MIVGSKKGLSNTLAALGFVAIIIFAAVGWGAYAAFPMIKTSTASTITSTQTQTQTQTIQISGSTTLTPVTQTVTTTLSGSTVTATGASSCTTPGTMAQVSAAVTNQGAPQSIMYVARTQGFLAQQGINLTTRAVTGAVLVSSLLAGQTNFAVTGLNSLLPAWLQGQQFSVLSTVGFTGNDAGGILVSNAAYDSGIRNVSQLHGQRVGSLAPPGGAYYIASVLYPKYFNVNYTVITFSSVTTEINALKTGQIVAMVAVSIANMQTYTQAGLGKTMLDPATVTPAIWNKILTAYGYPSPNGAYQSSATVFTTPSYIQQNPKVVQGFMNALTEAYAWIQAHNTTQVVNSLEADPFVSAALNSSALIPDIAYFQNYESPSLNMTSSIYISSLNFALATNPAYAGNQTKLLGSYNALVNPTFTNAATWCYNAVSWNKNTG